MADILRFVFVYCGNPPPRLLLLSHPLCMILYELHLHPRDILIGIVVFGDELADVVPRYCHACQTTLLCNLKGDREVLRSFEVLEIFRVSSELSPEHQGYHLKYPCTQRRRSSFQFEFTAHCTESLAPSSSASFPSPFAFTLNSRSLHSYYEPFLTSDVAEGHHPARLKHLT